MYLFGIKNDYDRKGFRVCMPCASNQVVCQVLVLKAYMRRTEHVVGSDGPVFVSLNKPYSGLTVSGISGILNKAVELVGLKEQGFSAKCFRPSGATNAVEAGVAPEVVQSVGRWKSTETFQTHYVHARPPKQFTDNVLCI